MPVRSDIRNVGIVAHVDAGKTTITEHMLYYSGKIRTMGSVDKGTAHTDWLEVERNRGISVRSSFTSFNWRGININLIDTPGHVDFSSEVERSLAVLDGVVLVISAAEGVQPQTEVLWHALRAMKIPSLIFINKIDRTGSDISGVLDKMYKTLSKNVVPMQVACGEGTQNIKILDILEGQGMGIDGKILKARNSLIERLADLDDGILEYYMDDREILSNMLYNSIIKHVQGTEIFPVLYGSAIKGIGIEKLMDAIVRCLPAPSGNVSAPLSGMVFKIDHDRTLGRVAHVRIYSGSIKNRDIVLNSTLGIEEKVTQVKKVDAQKYENVPALYAGDIGSLCGIEKSQVGDMLGGSENVYDRYHFAVPVLKVEAFPSNESEYPALVQALRELEDEDPLLEVQWFQRERQLLLKIMGTIQLEILSSLIKSRFGLDARFGKAAVIYKETPSSSGEGFVSYTMPKPCWAVLRFLIEPGERGSGVKYSSTVRTEDILERYQKQVEKTIPKALEQGLYGWEVTDIKITLIGGEYNVMHTHPPDFAIATPMGIMDGLSKTGTTLLEPILGFRISVPEEMGGRILSDLVQMRAAFESPVVCNDVFTVEGNIPAATSLDYPIKLASLSGGRGIMAVKFSGYRECPLELGAACPRHGENPLDRARYILSMRNAFSSE